MSPIQNILLIRLRSIGDVLLTLPAVNIVRKNFPDSKITFLTSKENIPLLIGFREVNTTISIDRALFRSGNPLKIMPEFFGLLRQLRAGKFSLVVDFQGYGETAWLTRLTGAPQRWGSVYGKGRQWAYTLGVARDKRLHHADRSLAVLHAGGLDTSTPRNHFVLPASQLETAIEFFQKHLLNPAKPTLFIQPFTSVPRKNWPLEKYLEVARHWRAQGRQVIFGGGPADRMKLEPVFTAGFPVAAGAPLLTTGALIQHSSLVLGGDTGILHLAVAIGRRVAMIMESTKPGSAFPFQHPEWALTPDQGRMVADIATLDVLAFCEQAQA